MPNLKLNPYMPAEQQQQQLVQMQAASGNLGPLLAQILGQVITGDQKAFGEAKQANIDRYNDILELFGVTRGRVMNDLADFGQSRVDEENRNWDEARDNLITDLASRGLAGSTARIPVETRTTEGRNRGLREIQDQLRAIRSEADTSFTDKAAGVMERRSDTYPEQKGADIASILGTLMGGMGGGGGMAGGLGGLLSGLTGQPKAQRWQYNVGGTLPRVLPNQARPQAIANTGQQVAGNQMVLKQAMDNLGTSSLGRQQQINQAQLSAMYNGAANWNPYQTAPTIPGAPANFAGFGWEQRAADPRLANAATSGGGYGGAPGIYSQRAVVNGQTQRDAANKAQRDRYLGSDRRMNSLINMSREQELKNAQQAYFKNHAAGMNAAQNPYPGRDTPLSVQQGASFAGLMSMLGL
jgi:hypothetical protein